jgi:hypothetical protein
MRYRPRLSRAVFFSGRESDRLYAARPLALELRKEKRARVN